jgi:hypothetical protein
LDADGAAVFDGAEGAAGFVAAAVDLDAPTGKEIGNSDACAAGWRETGRALGAKGLAIAASCLGEDKFALHPRPVKKA